MADAVDTQILRSGRNRYTVHLSNLSDGTGESAVTKIDRSSLTGPDGVNAPTKLIVEEIAYDIQGFDYIQLDWDDGTNQLISYLSGQSYMDFRHNGGLVPDDHADQTVTPANGDILLTTGGTVTSGDTYAIQLTVRLKK